MGIAARVLFVMIAAAAAIVAQDRPLPDARTLLEHARDNLRHDWQLDESYTYMERRTDFSDDPSRKVVRVYEVRPGPSGRSYRLLVEENGRRRTAEEMAKDEREHEQRVADGQRDLAAETPSERQRRLQRQAKRRADEQRMWDDVGRVYAFTIAGREQSNGHPLVIVDFTPKPNAQPLTDNGKRMMKAKGRAWISEADDQVERIEAQVLDDISIGWGLIGKLYAGANATYIRTRTDGGAWLPQQLAYTGSGRALIKRFALRTVIDYYDFKKIENGKRPD